MEALGHFAQDCSYDGWTGCLAAGRGALAARVVPFQNDGSSGFVVSHPFGKERRKDGAPEGLWLKPAILEAFGGTSRALSKPDL